MPATPDRVLFALAVFLGSTAWQLQGQEVAAVVTEEKPPSVEQFEEPAAAVPGQTNESNFRFTYPVRDAASDRLYTEANPPPASVQNSVERKVSSNAASAQLAAEESLALTEDQIIGDQNLPETPMPDIGEGRFSKRPFRFSFAVYEGYNSNVNGASVDPVESLYTSVAAGVDYIFGTSRLNLEILFDAGVAFYYNNSELQNDGIFPTVNLGLNATYKATPKLELQLSSSTGLLSQPNFSSAGGGPSNYQGDYISSSTTLSALYSWTERFDTITTYAPLLYYYFQPTGENFSYFDQTIGQQFIFLWKPLTQLVAEYRFNLRNYFELTDYNSLGNYALLGFNHTLNPRARVIFRGGAEQRLSQNPVAGGNYNYVGPFGQLDFVYAFGDRTSISLTSRYGTTGTGISNYTKNQQFLVGLSASHRFGRRLTLGAFANYQNNYYAQPGGDVDGIDLTPSFTYNVLNAGINAGYYLMPDRWSLQAGYAFTGTLSGNTEQQGDYTQNVVFLGTQVDF